MILTRSTRLSQPQGPVELDYTNPLVRGVVVAWVPSSSKNLVGGRPASVGGVVKPGEIGLVRATTGTQKAFTAPDSLDQRTENFTSFSILRRVGELPINFDGVGKNWWSNTGPTYVSDTVAYNANSEGQNSIRAVFGRAEGLTPTDVYSGQETTEWHSIASTHDGSTGSLYVSGVLRASVAVQPVVYGASGDNSFGANTSGKSGSMEYALVLRWNRALSAGEIASIEANPWQLFRPAQRRVYFDMGAGGGATTSVSTDLAAEYKIRSTVYADGAGAYAVRAVAAADVSADYSIRGVVPADSTGAYLLRGSASSDLSASYDIQTASGVSSSLSASYHVRAAVQSDASAAYAIRTSVSSDKSVVYSLRESALAQNASEFVVRAAVSTALPTEYLIRASVYASDAPSYAIRGSVENDVYSTFAVREGIYRDLVAEYFIELGMSAVFADTISSYYLDGREVFFAKAQRYVDVPFVKVLAVVPVKRMESFVPP